MKITTSYAVKIKHINKLFKKTITIYNEAVSFCCEKFLLEWDYLLNYTGNRRKSAAERLIHSTKSKWLNTILMTNFIKCLLI